MKFRALIINALDDSVELQEIEAKNEDEAYEQLDESSNNYDTSLLFNLKRWDNLKKVV